MRCSHPHGSQNDRMFDIADVPFSQVSEDEKRKFSNEIKSTGSYRGYKPRQFWVRSLLRCRMATRSY